jgi:hypothetical protein
VSIFGLALLAALGFFFLRQRRETEDRTEETGSMSVDTPEMGKYYVKRGTIQRQEDLGLSEDHGIGDGDQIGIGMAHGGEGGRVMGGGGGGGVGPDIPPRSPSRAVRGGGDRDNYF